MPKSNRSAWVIIAMALSTAFAAAEPPALHWSRADTDTAPDGKTQFHGPFLNSAVGVDAAELPAHDFLRIECDVLILRSWDGSYPYPAESDLPAGSGPDYFRIALPGGPVLLSTTFSNLPVSGDFDSDGITQNFPSPVFGDIVAPQTGATAKNTLGYHFPFAGPPQLVPMDATYHLTLLVPHHDATVRVQLEAMGLSNMVDESWGVGDVKITPLPADQVPTPDDEAIGRAFATALDLQSTDQPAAVNTLVAGMDHTVAWIVQNVQPQGIDAGAVDAAIKNLSADDAHTPDRTAARQTLFEFGPAVEPYLRDARVATHGEPRARVERILARLDDVTIPTEDLRRVILATRVLEIIGTPTAMEVRRHLVRTS